ncbi:hypothetical protein E3N88_32588 [Mikania micrantha]|uniref:Uncharacterized protein n=1 Tax=Mikania micrantha TaxID=192012 RepID=A0A5N6MBH6_9ASTR|nr:hypothetical protein E3N88_32588 [Mikania micrantha]
MKTILEANGLWEMIEPTVNTVEDVKKDKAAPAYLFQAFPEELIIQVASSKSAKEVWDTLKIRHVGIDQVINISFWSKRSRNRAPSWSRTNPKTKVEEFWIFQLLALREDHKKPCRATRQVEMTEMPLT